LDDEVLINTLAESKVTSDDIKIKVAQAEKIELSIDETREVDIFKTCFVNYFKFSSNHINFFGDFFCN